MTPDRYIETGTLYGASARMASELFRTVETIELSKVMAADAAQRLFCYPNVTVFQGASGDVLPSIDADEPCVFYLDAHGCKEINTAGQGHTGLWDELEYLARREQPDDLVIVDDFHAFGGGADGPNPFWADTTETNILKALGRAKRCGVFGDQFAASCRNG